MKFKCLRQVKSVYFLENAHKFQKLGYSCIIVFVCKSNEEMHKYMQYEISMTAYMGRMANQRNVPK